MVQSSAAQAETTLPGAKEINSWLAPFRRADTRKAIGQLLNTLIPYIALWVLMYYSLRVSYLLTLLLAVPAAGFMTRLFIFFHDCGHNSFFPSTRLNRAVGFWLGVVVFTPSEHWWYEHAIHHATSGNLDKRGVGDVTTLTLDEYKKMSPLARFGYRLFRHPLVMFGLGPIYMFLITHRIPKPQLGSKLVWNVIWSNLALAGVITALSLWIGFKAYLLIQLPILWMAGAFGIWLFYIQHQYDGAYWRRTPDWNYIESALVGASYYRLPGVLQWFSGNIGFHHIHHLAPLVPNYLLDKAYNELIQLRPWTHEIDLRSSVHMAAKKLWDEEHREMVGFTQQ
jgi:acyl-lipid omega-6 desaturase (Delta-12 desaturase)